MSVLIHVDHTPDIDIEHALRGPDIEIQGWHYDRLPGIVDQVVKSSTSLSSDHFNSGSYARQGGRINRKSRDIRTLLQMRHLL